MTRLMSFTYLVCVNIGVKEKDTIPAVHDYHRGYIRVHKYISTRKTTRRVPYFCPNHQLCIRLASNISNCEKIEIRENSYL